MKCRTRQANAKLLEAKKTYGHYICISRLEYVASCDCAKTFRLHKVAANVLSVPLVITDNNGTILHDGNPTATEIAIQVN